jgi:acetyl-CoA carboxylase beta subunit
MTEAEKQHLDKVLGEIKECLDKFEKAGFEKNLNYQTDITDDLKIIQVMEALIHAEQELKQLMDNGNIEVIRNKTEKLEKIMFDYPPSYN